MDGDDVKGAPLTAVMSYDDVAARVSRAMRRWWAARSG